MLGINKLNSQSRINSKSWQTIDCLFGMPDKTWADLEQISKFQKFMKEYIDLLQNNLQKIEVRGHSHNLFNYTCGQAHDRRDPSWQLFKLLWDICKKYDYDPLKKKLFVHI